MVLKIYQNKSPTLAKRVYVDETAVLVGDIQLEDDSSIWPQVAARGDVNQIQIGQRTNIQDGSVLHVTRHSEKNPAGYPLYIGDDVTVGHHATLHGCCIGNCVLVGMGAIVLDGAIIEDNVMVGAGSLVPPGKRLQSGYLYMGSPVTRARALTDDEIKFLKQSAENYRILKDEYLSEASAK
ncbi:gamma carbonic anhydrase family protein [Celerinatantimonas diazotrophica]|uniref:Carbonic anhydrase/acetyltransferase-like protein (Isoleucine patch superfamily) n=1 Tax=Celerinatantimonas diazotrophica TaxID=412034 RepID=A0A4V2PNA4_9GAMM|nr:gamma carbonic anhydrase family protein [Celerinatantimonas diazotrophica]TCK46298.1 carbonic anhydrase/acetyltransferase-like protein (isoleucine patch superfamily) [Celerinatantimonas diazotrophica]CAG9295328.1 Protein YrdA [Celerinatantimonas diazotrophica]